MPEHGFVGHAQADGCSAVQCAIHVSAAIWEDALEPQAGITRMEDERERTATLRAYGRDYPILLSLLPARPPDSVTCRQCSGSGFMSLQSVEQRTFQVPCSACAGVGWQI